ncbi:DUF1810 domain-containing protein [uncultured Thomasclavelia sp.]|uniref:DUF1810 domain-containing protein n=1 Tax=uncultured Thomasclavelia sp. TaxID=3025759 RepID=UPI00280B2B17|nr:DUF1810 domain-containing protein [uncultured Thomasclavelia sp.]
MADLQRFIDAQKNSYDQALKEIKNGCKISHWMWYIFPQIKGLGHSSTAVYYAIDSLDEAKEYLQNPILNKRLFEISNALLELKNNNPVIILGYPDNLKLQSSMTLFYVASKNKVFKHVIDKFYDGQFDKNTLRIIGIETNSDLQ